MYPYLLYYIYVNTIRNGHLGLSSMHNTLLRTNAASLSFFHQQS